MGTLYFKGRSYTPSDVEANPSGSPTDILETVGIGGTVYDLAGGVIDNILLYTLQQGARWETFPNPNSDCPLIVEALGGGGVIARVEVDVSKLPSRDGGDYYVTVCSIPNIQKNVNMATSNSGATINISVNDVFDTSLYSVKVYRRIGNSIIDYFNPQIYSLEEREVGIWIDNKPLYQKTFDLNNVVVSDNTWTNDILSTHDTGIHILNYNGVFGLGSTNYEFGQFAYYRNSSEYFTVTLSDNDSINIRPNMNAGTPVTLNRVTIWYTKDIDTPGSGQYNTLGVPNHHYDDTEKIVGTWFGETLYERTFNIQQSLSVGDNQIPLNIPNFKELIDVHGRAYCNAIHNIQIPMISGNMSQYVVNPWEYDSNGNLHLEIGSVYISENVITDVYITLQYTKTQGGA